MKIKLSLLFFVLLFLISNILLAQDTDWEKLKETNPTLDTDKDGIPDWWEIKYGLNPKNRFDARMDPDGDKINNLQEFQIDSDPKNAEKIDGVPKDWLKYYKLTDPNADDDKDGASNKEEFEAGTDPTNPEDFPKKEAVIEVKRQQPSMAGVRENIDPNIPDNHEIRKGVFKYNDPIGDDKGPGYYTYPTNPVYVSGAFDIVSFEVDTTPSDTIIFKITVNADLKQDWGMAADFDIQHFQIYIDTDRVPGSGQIMSLPGVEVLFAPEYAWDRVVIVSPQPESRVQVEADVKAKDMREYIVIPSKISGQGKTITAIVKKKDLGVTSDTDFSKWAYQVVSQSNEGFPDPEDLLTRNVNEYRGLHRFGGGSDDPGDPELMDILVWPAKGTLKEAEDQFAILNVWTASPDPKMAVKAVIPLVDNESREQWAPKGGYEKFARDMAAKIKPPVSKDKYVSGNFDFYFKLFTRYMWNLDPLKENWQKNSLEVGFDAKVFSDMVDFYMRWELENWEGTLWTLWDNSTPAQEAIALQSARCILINPLPTVNSIYIGNYELNYNPWVLGAAWYPDRDKFKGIFIDGSIENIMDYGLNIHYPLNWIGLDWSHGKFTSMDFAYGAKFNLYFIPGLKINNTTVYYTDFEISPIQVDNEPKKLIIRGYNLANAISLDYKLKMGFADLSLFCLGAYSTVKLGDDFTNLELTLDLDIDGNGVKGGLKGGGINMSNMTDGFAGVGTLKLENMFGFLSLILQGFYVDYTYVALGADRGDTGIVSFGGSPSADVLEMSGNQSAHRAPQAADFYASEPIPGLPTEFLVNDPVYGKATITWINNNWEGIASLGWIGGTVKILNSFDFLKLKAEFSYIKFNNPDYTNFTQFRGELKSDFSLVQINSMAGLTFKYYNLFDEMINALVLIPNLYYQLQVNKYLSTLFQYQYELGIYKENQNDKYFNRHRFYIGFNYALPIGVIKDRAEIWFEPKGTGINDFTGRQWYGAYSVLEWEYAF